ncbi:Ig-like domain-containing protein [Erwinia psidii]|uniref:Ig-like domain-containing protein n=1 Tax=Erwinia psidii TaxID=69224 RepID=UPI00226B5F58|nr:Ig-like domain-containing protein [Erwinia psidii]
MAELSREAANNIKPGPTDDKISPEKEQEIVKEPEGFFLDKHNITNEKKAEDSSVASVMTDALPPAENEKKENTEPSLVPLNGLKRLWQIMGSDERTKAGINTITGIASGVANNAVRDWLGQSSNSRLEFSSSGSVNTDLLLPLWENADNVLFGQAGIRRNDERTTYNLGSGWRHFVNDQWMLGINGFWDHDITGNNSRVGIGLESWHDYLKFAANGYFRLTNWHQSPLSAMEDYDERPANGYDINWQSWIPFYPQLGAALKFEKYFGKGVIAGNSSGVSALKDSPHALTTGLNYTPLPLLTLSVGHRNGSVSETWAALSLNYRTGLSWNEQTDSRSVGVMRSLAGSRYDFVDRNYNIVMQYRKQNLISLSLPATLTVEAASTVIIESSVTAKYGLKNISFKAPELLAAGGSLSPISATAVAVTIPAYLNDSENVWRLTAIATDTHGNDSDEAETLLQVIRSSNTVGLTMNSIGDIIANGSNEATATALLTDKNGAPLSNMAITFSLSGPGKRCIINGSSTCKITLQSDTQGQATIRLSTVTAGNYTLLATMDNGNSDSKNIHFIADISTAKIKSLEVTKNNVVANGTDTASLAVTVTDANENLVANQAVSLTAAADLLLSAGSVTTGSVTTGSDGTATLTATSNTAATLTVTATANGSTATADVTFVADRSTATVTSLEATPASNLTADGKTQSVLTAVVKDAQNNLVSGMTVTFSADNQAQLSSPKATTDNNGQISITVTSRRAGNSVLKATVNDSTTSTTITFVADRSTAVIGSLTVTTDNATADGKAANALQVTVVDGNGNPVADQVVALSAPEGLTLSAASVTTGSDGTASLTATSTTAATLTVTAKANGSSASAEITFVADRSTAVISALTVTTDNATADGKAANALQVTVVDGNGNPVADQVVALSAPEGLVLSAASVTTGSDGTASLTATSTTAATLTVTAKANGSSASAEITFVADRSTAVISALTVTTDNATADGKAANALQVTVVDGNGNPVADQVVALSAAEGLILSAASVTTGSDGTASLTATSTTAATLTVTAKANGSSASAEITFVAGEINAGNSTFTISNSIAPADGETSLTLTLTAKDLYGNDVTGADISFISIDYTDITVSNVSEEEGVYTATIVATQAGSGTISVYVNGSSLDDGEALGIGFYMKDFTISVDVGTS